MLLQLASQLAVVTLDLLSDRLQKGRSRCCGERLVQHPTPKLIVAPTQQVAQFSKGRLPALQTRRHGHLPEGLHPSMLDHF